MQYRQAIDLVLLDCERLGLKNPETGHVDAVEAELAMLRYLQWITSQWDLDGFTVINDDIAITTTGERAYPLPPDFGRLMVPTIEQPDYGIFLHNGSSEHGLRYRNPRHFRQLQATTNSVPSYFTIMKGSQDIELRLDPAPDANNSNNYTIRGVYIQDVREIDRDMQIPVNADAVIKGTIGHLATTYKDSQAPILDRDAERARIGLIHHQQRLRTVRHRPTQWSRARSRIQR